MSVATQCLPFDGRDMGMRLGDNAGCRPGGNGLAGGVSRETPRLYSSQPTAEAPSTAAELPSRLEMRNLALPRKMGNTCLS